MEQQRHKELENLQKKNELQVVLSKVFPYLSHPDLLRVAQVGKVWRESAHNWILWQNVTFKNCQLNFEDMGMYLVQEETKKLTLIQSNFCSFEYWEMAREYFLFPMLYEKLEELVVIDVDFDESLFNNFDQHENMNIKRLTIVPLAKERPLQEMEPDEIRRRRIRIRRLIRGPFRRNQAPHEPPNLVLQDVQNYLVGLGYVSKQPDSRKQQEKRCKYMVEDFLTGQHYFQQEPIVTVIKEHIFKLKHLKSFTIGFTNEYYEHLKIQQIRHRDEFRILSLQDLLKKIRYLLENLLLACQMTHLEINVVEWKSQ